MKQSLMISIHPKHLVNILNGNKTLELRKTVPKDFKGWVYIYCTNGVGKSKYHHLYNLTSYNNGKTLFSITHHNKHGLVPDGFLNGKVVARFWFDEYETYNHDNHGVGLYTDVAEYNVMYDDLEKLCLDYREVENYGKGKDLYAWHIKKLEIFDTPLSLSDFYRQLNYPNGEIITPNICEFSPFDYDNDLETCLDSFRLQRPPQSWQYIYKREEKE